MKKLFCDIKRLSRLEVIHLIKRTLISILFVFSALSCIKNEDEPEIKYSGNAASLKTEIHERIKTHTVRSYGQLWNDFRSTDMKSNGKVNDLYSNKTNYTFGSDQDSGGGDLNTYNREHSVPKSWWGSEYNSPMYTDLYHLYPSDSQANSQRGNLPYGEVNKGDQTWGNGYCRTGTMEINGFSGLIFEPNDAIKGNLARTYFYFATCYEDKVSSSWPGSTMLNKTKYPFYQAWTITLLLKWNKMDPVDDMERSRHEAIYKIQKNRNPFIDDPELAEYIWGNKMGQTYDMSRLK